MDNETKEMFQLLLSKFDGMDKRFEGIEKRLDGMDKRLDGMDKRFDGIDKRLDGMEKRLESVEKRQDEIYMVVKSIEHSNEVHKAEIDNMTYKIAHTEGTLVKIANVIMENRMIK